MRDDVVHQVRCRLRHPARAAWRAAPTPLAAEGQQLVVAAFAAAQPQEVVGQDAALEEGVELVLDESRQLGARTGLGVGDEAGRVLLHQAVKRGLLGAVAFVVERDAIRRPLGSRPMACAMGSRRGESARSQAALRASIALRAACRCVPSAAGLPF